jgi:hypothetical protein
MLPGSRMDFPFDKLAAVHTPLRRLLLLITGVITPFIP